MSPGLARAMRYLLRYIAPGLVKPALAGKSALTSTGGPSAKPSPSRSGSTSIIPPTFTVCVPIAKLSPGFSPNRSTAPGASQASPGGGAPTVRPSCSFIAPTSGQLASTALSSTGAARSPARAMACSRVPPDTLPSRAKAARSASVAGRCHIETSMSPPRISRPRVESSRSIASVSVPIAASAPTPRNRQTSSSRRPLNRADRSRRAMVQAVRQGRTPHSLAGGLVVWLIKGPPLTPFHEREGNHHSQSPRPPA